MDQEKKGIYGGGVLLIVIFAAIIIGNWLATLGFFKLPEFPSSSEGSNRFERLNLIRNTFDVNSGYIRIAYVIILPALTLLMPTKRKFKNDTDDKYYYFLLAVIMTIVVLVGYKTNLYVYNLSFILFFLIHIVVVSRATAFLKNKLQTVDFLAKVSNIKNDEYSFSFKTEKGQLTIHNPFQGVLVEGGAGSGKTKSLIDPVIHQGIQKGYAAVIYDFKGDPPTLGLTAYNSWLQLPKKIRPEFAIINFTNLYSSIRVNPISPKYITNMLFAKEAADTLMKNLEKSWIEKTDFWAKNAINYIQGIIWILAKSHKQYCTLPHVVSIALSPYDVVLDFLMEDEDLQKLMQPLYVAHSKNAESQIAGMVSSSQLPVTLLYNKELYQALGPREEEETSLDISNPESPMILTICNNPKLKESLSPAISLILSCVMSNINQQGKRKALFCIDELPTIYIKNLDNLPATARSNKVASVFGVQDRTQLTRDYGKKESDTLLANLGNIFVGMTNNLDTAKQVTQLVGKNDYLNTSYSTNETVSVSESLKEKSILQERDIMGQEIGHFTGKIAGGKPALFSAQMPEFKHSDVYGKVSRHIPEIGIEQMKFRTGDIETDRKIFDELVIANFNRINNDVQDLLAPYKIIKTE